jgi:hypothetical protein
MELVGEEPAPEEVLFADKTLGGYVVVRENRGGEEARLDLETLFNTVTRSRARVAALFERQASGSDGAAAPQREQSAAGEEEV